MNQQQPQQSLFSNQRLVSATLVFGAAVIMTLLMVSAGNGFWNPIILGSLVALVSSFYVIGDFVRSKGRFTTRAVLTAMFGIALCSALWGQTIITGARQKMALSRARAVGADVASPGRGDWVVVAGGWIVPGWVERAFGVEFFYDLKYVEFSAQSISADDLREVDCGVFPYVYFYNCRFEPKSELGFSGFLKARGLSFGQCNIDDNMLKQISEIGNLEQLTIYTSNDLTNLGIQHLHRLANAQQIALANLPNVSDDAIKALAEALPKCDVTSLNN